MSDSPRRRVVITGMGVISPLGNSHDQLWDALISGRSGVGPMETMPAHGLPVQCAAEAREFTGHIDNFGPLEKSQKKNIRKGLKVMCREIQMGVASAQLALSNAGLNLDTTDCQRTGVVFGSDYMMTRPEEFVEGIRGCLNTEKKFQFGLWAEFGLPKVEPLWLLKYLPNMPASHIAIYNDLRGPSNSITLREASGNLSIAEAFCTIQRGSADVMLAGATGTRVHPMRTVHVAIQEELASEEDDPSKLSRPFDQNRSGLVMGEGAGSVVLEDFNSALKRNAKIYGEIIGYSSSSVIDRNTRARSDKALENVIRGSFNKAGLSPDQVGHVHAHGLSTRQGDRDEARAISQVWGQHNDSVPIVAAKSHMGNLGAGSGIVELVASLLALENGTLFPVLNYETPDPECPIGIVSPGQSPPAGQNVLNINVTPQGQASALLVSQLDS